MLCSLSQVIRAGSRQKFLISRAWVRRRSIIHHAADEIGARTRFSLSERCLRFILLAVSFIHHPVSFFIFQHARPDYVSLLAPFSSIDYCFRLSRNILSKHASQNSRLSFLFSRREDNFFWPAIEIKGRYNSCARPGLLLNGVLNRKTCWTTIKTNVKRMLEANLNARDTKIKTRAGEQCKVLSLANVKINKTEREPAARARKCARQKEREKRSEVEGLEIKLKLSYFLGCSTQIVTFC